MGKRKHSRNRSRDRNVSKRHRRRRNSTHISRSRSTSVSSQLRESLETIASRLNALEGRSSISGTSNVEITAATTDTTDKIVEAIHSLKSNACDYLSNFDLNVHNVDSWFDEVDRAQNVTKWSDTECLSRIGHCLKGDAKSWLDDWITTDRSWSNFEKDFKALCVKRIDMASIMYEVMSTSSDTYPTYAEYARQTLLRLRIVKGLSDELISAIVIRGINDPHVKASVTNANLMPNEIARQRTVERLKDNQRHQDEYVNRGRKPPRDFKIGDLVFVIKYAQSKGKLDPGMRGPYKVTRILEHGRYELKLLASALPMASRPTLRLISWSLGEVNGLLMNVLPFFAYQTEEPNTETNHDDTGSLEAPSTSNCRNNEVGPPVPDEDVRMSGEAVLAESGNTDDST